MIRIYGELQGHARTIQGDYMQNRYQVEIWFDQLPERIKLGTVTIVAKTQTEALELAAAHTEHWVIDEDKN